MRNMFGLVIVIPVSDLTTAMKSCRMRLEWKQYGIRLVDDVRHHLDSVSRFIKHDRKLSVV